MRRPRLFWRIYATYLVVIIVCTAAMGFYAGRAARSFSIQQTEAELRARAELVRAQLTTEDAAVGSAATQDLVRRLGSASGTRLTVIAADDPGTAKGTVLADSDVDPATMPDHSRATGVPPGLTRARERPSTTASSWARTCCTWPCRSRRTGASATVVRASVPLTAVNRRADELYERIAISAVVVALIAAAHRPVRDAADQPAPSATSSAAPSGSPPATSRTSCTCRAPRSSRPSRRA